MQLPPTAALASTAARGRLVAGPGCKRRSSLTYEWPDRHCRNCCHAFAADIVTQTLLQLRAAAAAAAATAAAAAFAATLSMALVEVLGGHIDVEGACACLLAVLGIGHVDVELDALHLKRCMRAPPFLKQSAWDGCARADNGGMSYSTRATRPLLNIARLGGTDGTLSARACIARQQARRAACTIALRHVPPSITKARQRSANPPPS
jgi:hypothetical protein